MFSTAFILGFAGSIHCMGMCSPLAMSVTNMSANAILSRIVYNSGRIMTYGIIGGVVASVGLGFPLIKYQNLLSILLGVSLLVIGLSGMSMIKVPFVTNALGSFSMLLKRQFSKFLQRKSYFSTFILGSLNGILPCGLSFLALTYCLTLAGPADGFIFMSAFGFGTLPVMLGAGTVFQVLISRFNIRPHKISILLLVISGILLLYRGTGAHSPHVANPVNESSIVICR